VTTIDVSLTDSGDYCLYGSSSVSTPEGLIVVLWVTGEVDLDTVSVLDAALNGALRRRPTHVIVDLAGSHFRGVAGLALLRQAAIAADEYGTGYAFSGVSRRLIDIWKSLWPEWEPPTQYPTVAAGVRAALARQIRRPHPARPPAYRQSAHLPHAHRPALTVTGTDADRYGRDTDQRLAEKSRAGDADAYRALARRHRARMYHSALRTLTNSGSPEDVMADILAHLRASLALLADASPP
jgi:anti-anti-sigma regulatory factor